MDFATRRDLVDITDKTSVGLWVQELIDKDVLHLFYSSPYWRQLRREVLAEYKGKCQDCMEKRIVTPATHVHHEQWVRSHPELALSKTYYYDGKELPNLVPLCHDCHEERHGRRAVKQKSLLTEEWW